MRYQVSVALILAMTISEVPAASAQASPGTTSGGSSTRQENASSGRTPDERNTIQVFKQASRGVVHVKADFSSPDATGKAITSLRTGSGFLIDTNGHILTNYHVIDGVSRVLLMTHNGRTLSATVIGTAPAFDIALLKADLSGIEPGEVQPLPLGSSETVEIGQKVLAIGNPLGLHNALTTGIVSGLWRDFPGVPEGLGQALIQTAAAINPGNSGGPLLDSSGRVIGINSASVRDGQNIGFAIPTSLIKRVLPDLKAMGHAYRPTRLQDLTTLLLVGSPGDRVIFTVLRAGGRQEKAVTLPLMHSKPLNRVNRD